MVEPGLWGTMGLWPSHQSRPRPRCASAWLPGPLSGGPQLAGVDVRYRGEFAYVVGRLP
jgi:hypothetical protein